MADFLTTLRDRVLVFDGAFGTWVQEHDLGPDDFGGPVLEGCNEHLVLTRPDLIADLHSEFFAAGVDAVETATFGSFPVVLAEYDIPEKTFEMNEVAARIAKEVASGFSTPERPRFVIGSIGPGTKLPSLGHIRFAELRDAYVPQVEGLLTGGVDALLIETVQDLLQGKAAIVAARRAMATTGVEVPMLVQVTMETTGRMLIGSEIGAALTALEAMKPDVMGLNCATGPAEMTEHLRYLAQHGRTFLSCLPNAGLPSVVGGRTHYDLTPEQLADAHERNVSEFGINIVGGCCGTTPAHLRAVVERLGADRTPTPRTPEFEPGCSSVYSHVPFHQELAYLAIGERTNANGSKKFREAMLEADWDTCVQMAKEQIKEGAHVLDVCVDYVGRDGSADMDEIAGRFATQAALPLVFDSTEPLVVEAGLQHSGGKAILNSANLEDGEAEGSRLDRVFSMAREYGAAVICLAIDEEGQARDADWKLRVCKRIYDIAVDRYGIDPTDLIFDALTFPLGAGSEDLRRDGIETIEAIRRIKTELPGASTVLGLSNVSFGLKPALRHVLNSVFLHECREAGLDAAIVHAARIMPMHKIDDHVREVTLDLIYDRRRDDYDPLQVLLELFEDVDASAIEEEDRSDWTVEELLKHRIIDGDRDGIEADLERQLETRPALSIVNDVLLDGMKVVGDLFGRGEMQLPFVLQSAETMKTAVAYLEPHMEKLDDGGKGVLVIGTVKGDVHDIGKNLVDIILTNNGYEVHNIGIKAPLQVFVDKAKEVNADAIGMSGLLVKSTLIMRENLQALNELGLAETPVMLGGAALTRTYVERDLREVYEGRLFYGKDAFEGLYTMDTLMDGKRTGTLAPGFGREAGGRDLPPRKSEQEQAAPVDLPERSDVALDVPIFTPPFLGSRVAKGVSLDEIVGYLNETALFRNQWQFRPDKTENEDDTTFKERLRHTLAEELSKAKAGNWLVPAVVWGYFPVNADGDELIVWRDEQRTEERVR
ncbi:MAG: methionine synthase, partial [Acidimicrobiia bacterium]